MTRWMHRSTGRAVMLAAMLTPCLPLQGTAQEEEPDGWTFGIAGEVVSQFIWRGLQLADGPSIQPDLFVKRGGLSAGVWSSWALDGDYSEIDTYVAWFTEASAGEFGLTATDYFYPYLSGDADDFSNFGGVIDGEGTGAHTIEIGGEFTPSALPVTVFAAWNAYNDPDRSLFAGVRSEVSMKGFDVGGEIGMLLNDSPYYYGAGAGDVMNYTVQARRAFSLGAMEPYVSVAFVRSPLMKEGYWVFAVGF